VWRSHFLPVRQVNGVQTSTRSHLPPQHKITTTTVASLLNTLMELSNHALSKTSEKIEATRSLQFISNGQTFVMSRSIFNFSSSPLQNALPNLKDVKKKRFRKLRKRSFAPKK
jgi:hypothetical protein